MKINVSCKDCPWYDKKKDHCSIDNNYYGGLYACYYINKDYSITNLGLNTFYYGNNFNSIKKVNCKDCPYKDKNEFRTCKLDSESYFSEIDFECLYVNEDYSLTREGKKKLLEGTL